MNIGVRLKKIRSIRNMTLAGVAEMVGKTEATIQRYESGDIVNLKLDIIEKLAEVYKVSPAYLMGWETETPMTFKHEYKYFPISIAAGLPVDIDTIMEKDVESIILPDDIMGKWAGSSDIIIMRVNGESMNKSIPNTSLIAVKQVNVDTLKDNDIVVFSNGYDYSVKRFYNDKENYRFIFKPDSYDKGFTDYIVPYAKAQELKLHGKVVVYIVVED